MVDAPRTIDVKVSIVNGIRHGFRTATRRIPLHDVPTSSRVGVPDVLRREVLRTRDVDAPRDVYAVEPYEGSYAVESYAARIVISWEGVVPRVAASAGDVGDVVDSSV